MGSNTGPNPIGLVAGAYHATEITLERPGNVPLDAIELGATVELVLTRQGTTSGTLVRKEPPR